MSMVSGALPTPVLGLDPGDEMLRWARRALAAALRNRLRRWKARKRPMIPSPERVEFMAEYLVWKATPLAWRPEHWPHSESELCKKAGRPITTLLWLRRQTRFDGLVKRAKRFQPGQNERIMDARNVAHQMILRQPELDPRFADARWLSETAKIEGMTHGTPLLQINSTQNVLQLDAKDAEAQIADAVSYFAGKGKLLPEGWRTPVDASHTVRPAAMARLEGPPADGAGHDVASEPDRGKKAAGR